MHFGLIADEYDSVRPGNWVCQHEKQIGPHLLDFQSAIRKTKALSQDNRSQTSTANQAPTNVFHYYYFNDGQFTEQYLNHTYEEFGFDFREMSTVCLKVKVFWKISGLEICSWKKVKWKDLRSFVFQSFLTQHCFAFTAQTNFPKHNLNFHWRWRW